MKKAIRFIVMSCLPIFSSAVIAADQPSYTENILVGKWTGEFKGLSAKSVSDSQLQKQEPLISSDVEMAITSAAEGFCVLHYIWVDQKGNAHGYDGEKYVSQDLVQGLCYYQDRELSIVGDDGGLLFCERPSETTMTCKKMLSSHRHLVVGVMELVKSPAAPNATTN